MRKLLTHLVLSVALSLIPVFAYLPASAENYLSRAMTKLQGDPHQGSMRWWKGHGRSGYVQPGVCHHKEGYWYRGKKAAQGIYRHYGKKFHHGGADGHPGKNF